MLETTLGAESFIECVVADMLNSKRLLTFHSGKGGNFAPQNPAKIVPSPLNGMLPVQITLTHNASCRTPNTKYSIHAHCYGYAYPKTVN